MTTDQTFYRVDGKTDYTISATGVRTTYNYDGTGQLLSTTVDLDGNPATTKDQYTTLIYTYDELGRQIAVTEDRDGITGTGHTDDQYTTTYEYDAAGRVVKTTYSDPTNPAGTNTSSTSVQYDRAGQKSRRDRSTGNVTRYEYDDQGRLTAVILPWRF